MRHTQEWAVEQWKANLRGKLRGGQVGTKRWWSLVEEQQGEAKGGTIPSLLWVNGSLAHTALDKANLLDKHFAEKICDPNPENQHPSLPTIIREKLKTSEVEVKTLLLKVEEK